jgi:integrase
MKLAAKRVASLARQPGRYHDGFGLYLVVVNAHNASWQLRYYRAGRERWLGLGPLHTVGLAAARERARAARLQLLDGIDPVQARHTQRAQAKAAAAKAVTFESAAEKYFKQHSPKWTNSKHAGQFLSSLRRYAFAHIGDLPVETITTPLILRVLEQPVTAERGNPAGTLWSARAETASRVRLRIESVLDWAAVRGYRSGDNPARWEGYLDQVLPARTETARRHHSAVTYEDVPALMAGLAGEDAIAARALEFLILTAARTGEVQGATWSEIDLDKAIWTVPAKRMKSRREHKVPLSPAAIAVLKRLPHATNNAHLFIGLASTSMWTVLHKFHDASVHGLRSAFRTWASERTGYPREIAEAALAHVVGDETVRAYERTTFFDRRRLLMDAWATYCYAPSVSGDVVPLRGAQ